MDVETTHDWRSTVAILFHLLLAIFLLTDLYTCYELPVNLTSCEQFVIGNIPDTAEIDMPIIETSPPLALRLGNRCSNYFFKLQNNAIILNGNLIQYCADSIKCDFECHKDLAITTAVLTLYIRREANYTLKFKNETYRATARELTAETEIADLTKELLLTECIVSSGQMSLVFHILEQKPYGDWFYIQYAYSGKIYATPMVDYEQLNGTHIVNLVIQASMRMPNSVIDWNATTRLDVEILDVDDSNPYFTSEVYHLNIT